MQSVLKVGKGNPTSGLAVNKVGVATTSNILDILMVLFDARYSK